MISNAGIGGGRPDKPTRQQSRDGFELRFAVNYLAGFLLTLRLLELLRRSAPARVVNVSSLGQMPLDFDDVMLEHDYDGTRAYCQSKLAQVTSANFLAARIPADQVSFNSLHPATHMPTKIVEHRDPGDDSLETGIEAVLQLATGEELEGVDRHLLGPQLRIGGAGAGLRPGRPAPALGTEPGADRRAGPARRRGLGGAAL